jgi:putative addiction module component (TIGR02574 family)
MSGQTQNLLTKALALPAADRAALVDGLMLSLEVPNPTNDAKWLAEAMSRWAAFEAGEIAAYDADEVFAELEKSA